MNPSMENRLAALVVKYCEERHRQPCSDERCVLAQRILDDASNAIDEPEEPTYQS